MFVCVSLCLELVLLDIQHSTTMLTYESKGHSVGGGQNRGQIESGGMRSAIDRKDSKDAMPSLVSDGRDSSSVRASGETKLIFRRSYELHSGSASPDVGRKELPRRRRSSSVLSVLSCCSSWSTVFDSAAMGIKRTTSSAEESPRSALGRQGSSETAYRTMRTSGDEFQFPRRRRSSLDALRRDSALGLNQASRRVGRPSAASREKDDDSGFLDRAFENAVAISFGESNDSDEEEKLSD